jgi:hypothetical protein
MVLTGNTFTEGSANLDYSVLKNPGNIAGNKFSDDTSVTPPNSAPAPTDNSSNMAIIFQQSGGSDPSHYYGPDQSTLPSVLNDIALANPNSGTYPNVQDLQGIGAGGTGASSTAAYPFDAVYPSAPSSVATPVPALDHRALLLLAALALGMASLFLRGPLFGRK